ncbi:hypothetical protein LXL04_011599 [Taraxacum kok-saghyz]
MHCARPRTPTARARIRSPVISMFAFIIALFQSCMKERKGSIRLNIWEWKWALGIDHREVPEWIPPNTNLPKLATLRRIGSSRFTSDDNEAADPERIISSGVDWEAPTSLKNNTISTRLRKGMLPGKLDRWLKQLEENQSSNKRVPGISNSHGHEFIMLERLLISPFTYAPTIEDNKIINVIGEIEFS